MGQRTSHDPGTFSWAELSTTDAAGAKAFYSSLFGWEADDMPVGEGMTYTMLRLGDGVVGALYEQGEQERSGGIPPHWNSYVTVQSADEAAARAKDLGGTVVAPPFDVMDVGRMAIVQDPTGGTLSVWEPRTSIGATLVNDTGALCWNELTTPDPAAARDFYAGLFGLDYDEEQKGFYWRIRNGGRMNGGIRAFTEQEQGRPPVWFPYFTVESVDDDAGRVREGGGQVHVGAMDVQLGRIAVVADPQGAVFALFEGDTDE
jgi:predicted enzyme related to lactoylglutathione lyase